MQVFDFPFLNVNFFFSQVKTFFYLIEKRQDFIDSINNLKQTISDPEKHQNKLSKDDKVSL